MGGCESASEAGGRESNWKKKKKEMGCDQSKLILGQSSSCWTYKHQACLHLSPQLIRNRDKRHAHCGGKYKCQSFFCCLFNGDFKIACNSFSYVNVNWLHYSSIQNETSKSNTLRIPIQGKWCREVTWMYCKELQCNGACGNRCPLIIDIEISWLVLSACGDSCITNSEF